MLIALRMKQYVYESKRMKAMWLIFEKREDTHERVVYRYSRESRELDGLIEKDRVTGRVNMIRPCASDYDLVWCQYKAVREFVA